MSWLHAVAEIPLPITVGCVIVISVLFPWGAVLLVRRVWPYPALKENNELVGFTYAVFGLIYGVLLAYTIVVAWERFSEAERIVMRESTIVSEIWRDSQAFPDPGRSAIHQDLMDYATSVVQDEWKTMGDEGKADPRTVAIYERLWEKTYTLQPETKNQEAYLRELLARMNELGSTRRLRILYSRTEVQPILWLALVLGSVMTIAYTLLLANKHMWIQVLITSFITLIALLGLLVIVSFQFPFTGDVSVTPDAFHELLHSLHLRMMTYRAPLG